MNWIEFAENRHETTSSYASSARRQTRPETSADTSPDGSLRADHTSLGLSVCFGFRHSSSTSRQMLPPLKSAGASVYT